MKYVLYLAGLIVLVALSGCGSKDKAANTPDTSLQRQADVARASLQAKADQMAREASMSPPPQNAAKVSEKKEKK